MAKNYEIDGMPASSLLNVYSIGSYGDAINVEEPESEMMVRQKVVDHFTKGFGATEVNILHMEFVR